MSVLAIQVKVISVDLNTPDVSKFERQLNDALLELADKAYPVRDIKLTSLQRPERGETVANLSAMIEYEVIET